VAGATVGYGGSLAVDPLTGTFLAWRGMQRAGVQARPWRAPIWLAGETRLYQTSFFATVAEGRVGAELWWLQRPLRLWAVADGFARGTAAGDTPTVLEGRLSGGVGWVPRKELEVRVSGSGRGSARYGDWEPTDGPLPEPLWTAYREDHRTVWGSRLEVRVLPTPWLRLRAWGNLLGNGGQDPRALDGWSAMADLRAAAPWLRGSFAVGWTHRFEDLHRASASGSVALRGSLRGTAWTKDELVLQVLANAGYWPQWNRFGGEVGLRFVWAGREGLADLRPTEEDVRDVAVWGRSRR
jgi:hypothetical protein